MIQELHSYIIFIIYIIFILLLYLQKIFMGYFCSNPRPFYHEMLASENEGDKKYQKKYNFSLFCLRSHSSLCLISSWDCFQFSDANSCKFNENMYFSVTMFFSVKHFAEITFVHLSLTLDFLSFQNKLWWETMH